MIKRYNTLSLVSGAAGVAGIVIGAIVTIHSDSPGHSGLITQFVGFGLLLVGYVLLMVGFGFYAKAKGHSFLWAYVSHAFGLLGLLYLIGLKDRSDDSWNN